MYPSPAQIMSAVLFKYNNLPAKSVLFGLCTDDRKESFLALRSRVPLCFFFIFQGKFSRFSRRSACSIRGGFVAIYRDLVSPGYFVIFQFFFHCYGQLCWWLFGGGDIIAFFWFFCQCSRISTKNNLNNLNI